MLHIDIGDLIDHLHRPTLPHAWHLRVCRHCGAELKLLRDIRAALLPSIEVPQELLEKTLKRLFRPEYVPVGGRRPSESFAVRSHGEIARVGQGRRLVYQ